MSNVAKRRDVKEVLVKTNDGAVWEAEINSKGNILLIRQIIEPPKSGGGSGEGKSEESKKEEEKGKGGEKSESESKKCEGKSNENKQSKTPPPPGKSIYDDVKVGSGDDTLKKMEKGGGFNQRTQYNMESHRKDQPEKIKPMPEAVREKMKDNAFRARLSSIMLDNKYDRKLKGRTRGKLDMTRLYKVPTQARSVFTQKQSRRGKEYNVILVVDESGSMMLYDKSTKAAECAVFLAKAFEGININVAIIGFNHYITVRKEFNQPCDYDRVYEAIRSVNWKKGAGHNNDYDALSRAYHMLDTAPKGKNIVIMLSDGMPANSANPVFIDSRGEKEDPKRYYNKKVSPYEKREKVHLHHLVKSNDHRATSIGIGIMEGGWQIPEHFVINNVDELKPAVIKTLKSHIKRG